MNRKLSLEELGAVAGGRTVHAGAWPAEVLRLHDDGVATLEGNGASLGGAAFAGSRFTPVDTTSSVASGLLNALVNEPNGWRDGTPNGQGSAPSFRNVANDLPGSRLDSANFFGPAGNLERFASQGGSNFMNEVRSDGLNSFNEMAASFSRNEGRGFGASEATALDALNASGGGAAFGNGANGTILDETRHGRAAAVLGNPAEDTMVDESQKGLGAAVLANGSAHGDAFRGDLNWDPAPFNAPIDRTSGPLDRDGVNRIAAGVALEDSPTQAPIRGVGAGDPEQGALSPGEAARSDQPRGNEMESANEQFMMGADLTSEV